MSPTGIEMCGCSRRDDTDSGNETGTESRPLLVSLKSAKCLTPAPRGRLSDTDKHFKKRKLSMDTYLNISGLSLLSDRDESFSELTSEVTLTKRKVLDDKIQSTVMRNAHFRQRLHDLQEKRMQVALSPMCQDNEFGVPSLSTVHKLKVNMSPQTMSPRRVHRDRHRREMQQQNSKYKRKYLELQEKRFNLGSNLLDTSLPLSLPKPLLPMQTLTRTCSSPASTFPTAINMNSSRWKSSQTFRHRNAMKHTQDNLCPVVSPPRAPPRRKRQKNNAMYDIFATIQKNGDTRVDVVSRDAKINQLVMSPKSQRNVTSSITNGKPSVITVRFSYAYLKDGQVCTEF